MVSLTRKVINKLIGERDWSAQEVCYHLIDEDLRGSSRAHVSLDLRYSEGRSYRLDLEDLGHGLKRTALESYCKRDKDKEDISLLEYTRD